MRAEDVAWLQTDEGAAATRLATERLAATDELRTIEALRRIYAPEAARAALELALARDALSSKFADADALFADRAAAEQTSNERVAKHLAERFTGLTRVADLGCGMGGDTLAIAEHAAVVAVDRDPARLAMTAANARVRGLQDRVEVVEGDIEAVAEQLDAEECDAVWLDPARRDSGRRLLDPDRWSPSLEVAIAIASRFSGGGVKLAPGIDHERLPEEAEREFVSLGGRLVSAVLWLGDAIGVPRRATSIATDGEVSTLFGEADTGLPRVGAVGACLYDPDPSVGRAQLIRTLGAEIDAWQLDARVAYLSSDVATATPFARRFRVLASFPFSERALRDWLADQDVARVEVMRRGAPIEPDELASRLNARLDGTRVLTIALTRVGAEVVAIVCERERDEAVGAS